MHDGRFNSVTRRDGWLLGGATAAIATVVAILRALNVVAPATAALALLLVVLGVATLSGLWVAVATSVACMLVFNYFFLPPLHTLVVADPQNWMALFSFLVVALIASQLSAAARARTADALARRAEVARLFELSRDILLTTESGDAMPALARHVARRFGLDAVAICMPAAEGWELHQGGKRTIMPSATELDAVRAGLHAGEWLVEASPGNRGPAAVASSFIPLRIGARPIGLLATEGASLDRGVRDALGGIVAIAVERAHFLSERETARVARQRADLAGALLASLGHDLRTPLTAIRVAVTNLGDPRLDAAFRQTQSQLAVQEVDRLNRLFHHILDMARIDAAAIAPERQWVTAADVIDAAVQHAGTAVARRLLRIDARDDVEAEIDPRLTSSALAHVLENAAQYSPSEAAIDIRGWVDASGLHFTVRDYGPGLSAGEIEQLFERFFRGTVGGQRAAGTGMGLAIARGLLAAQDGRIHGENAAGGGACFTITVPSRSRVITGQEA